MQEMGHAGRTGKRACATLFYNNSDIASNKVHVQELDTFGIWDDTCSSKIFSLITHSS